VITPEDPVVLIKAVSVADTNYYDSATVLILTTVTLSPDSSAIKPGGEVSFTAEVSGLEDVGLTWYVNGEHGGNVVYGTVTDQGVYSAPLFIPNDPVITIKAVSVADADYFAQASVRIITSVAVELEDYTSFEGLGIHVTLCSAASGGRAVDGCDNEGEAIFYQVTFEHPGHYSAILRAAATKLAHRILRVNVFAAGAEGADQVADFDIEGKGIT
jgi:hypothetical protein